MTMKQNITGDHNVVGLLGFVKFDVKVLTAIKEQLDN